MFKGTQNRRFYGVIGKTRLNRFIRILLLVLGALFLVSRGGKDKFTMETITMETKTTEKRLNLIIVGHGRSGTTLLGEMFNHNPSVFYLFEPLQAVIRLYGFKENVHYHNLAMQYLNSIFRCNFSGNPKYLYDLDDFYRRQDHPLLSFAMVSPPLCPYNMTNKRWNPKKCCNLTKERLQNVCRYNYSLTVMKVLFWRVPNVDIRKLWYACASPENECKIIHLVRDPRAVMPSWKKFGFYKELDKRNRSSLSNNSNTICQQTVKTLNILKSLPSWLKSHYKLIRFEDMAVNPLKVLEEVYEFAGLPVLESVKKWLKNATSPDKKLSRDSRRNTVSVVHTVKDSMTVLNYWRNKADLLEVKIVEENCRSMMELMGYVITGGSSTMLKKTSLRLFKENYEAKNWLEQQTEFVPQDLT